MPKTIIVPLDGSDFAEHALPTAQVLADQSDATLVLVMSRLGGDDDPEGYLEAAAQRAGIGAHRTAVFADLLATTAIPMVADTEPDPLICMTTHGRTGPGLTLFGSIAEQVLHRTEVPVALIGPSVQNTPKAFTELVVCLDGSDRAAAMLDEDAALARDLDLGVWLVHVADPDWAPPAGVDATDTDESAMLRHAARRIEDGIPVNWETLHGTNVARAIVEYVTTLRAPMIALATRARTGVERFACGSVSISVVHHAPCPVIVGHTRGFRGA